MTGHTTDMYNRIRKGTCAVFFLPVVLLLLICTVCSAQNDNFRLPKMQYATPGDYDTVGYKIAQERTSETAGLMEREIDPEMYVLGPDDGIVVTIFAAKPMQFELRVSPEGKLIIPEVGVVNLKNKTLAQADTLVRNAVRRVFKTADVVIALNKLRTFKVTILGAVRKPLTVEASAADRVHEVIERAGGLLYNASLRRIRILRDDGRQSIPVDLYRFYTLGDREADPTVLGGDRIMVSYNQKRQILQINGDVARPDTLEYVMGDSLSTLLRFAGGFTPSSFLDSVEIVRFTTESEGVERFFLNLSSWDGRLDDGVALPGDMALQPGDRVYVRSTPEWLRARRVVVAGEVVYPGEYAISRNGERLTDLIARTGGFTDQASLEEAVLYRKQDIDVIDKEFQRLQKIPPSEMNEEELRYFRARARENRGLMSVDFKSLFVGGNMENNIVLRENDSVYVPPIKNFVNVLGRVNSPGNIVYRAGMSYEGYIALAGGYGYRADESETLVIKPKGEQYLAENRDYVIEPGDNILVPEEPDTKFIDIFTSSLTILAQVVTVVGVVITLTRLQ
jgi:protein involved in polysaccharide export with SLBB domain